MKKLFIIILLATSITANAQTIHWLTFIDTTDEGVGEMDKVGRKVLYSKFVNVVNAALAEKGYVSDVQDYWDRSTSPENCKKAVTNLMCGPEDIIVFYYIGHGGRPNNEDVNTHPFPQMFLAQNEDRRLVPLEWVHNTLKQKGARLTLTIGMCCNVKDPNMTIKNSPAFHSTVNYGNAYMSATGVQAIQKAFLESKGDIIATSASPTESSWGAVGYSNFGNMDDYTACFVDLFGQKAESGHIDWNTFLNEVRMYVKEVNQAMRRPGSQTPIFVSNVSPALEPEKQPREKPTPGVEKNIDNDEEDSTEEGSNILSRCLDYIIDKNIALENRVSLSDEFKKLFEGGAEIKVLGQDVDIVIDKESVENFLQRISTSRLLLKVIPIGGKVTSGNKIAELRVREYYIKH